MVILLLLGTGGAGGFQIIPNGADRDNGVQKWNLESYAYKAAGLTTELPLNPQLIFFSKLIKKKQKML